jgi:tRNA nucleotidyltransferase/poly(A) polymerase
MRLFLKMNGLLAGIAKERVRDELNIIITSERAAEGIRGLQTSGLMTHVIPEIEVMVGFDQRKFPP